MKHIKYSPINKNKLKPYISCKDYTVSHETFTLLIDQESELLVTTPRPNDEELEKYYESVNYISHTDAKKKLIDKIYQSVRNYTLKRKLKLINSLNSEEKTILDIGTGTGDFLLICKKNGWRVTGIEPNKKARELAEKKLDANLFIQTSSLSNKKYDIITLWHVLEHVPNLNEYISNLKKLLKSNGTLLIAVPNYKSFDALYYKEFWAAYDVPRHLWHFSKKAIIKLFQTENMKVEKIIPMKFDSYYVSLLSEKYKTGYHNFFKAFFVGFKSNRKAKASKEYSSHIYVIKNS